MEARLARAGGLLRMSALPGGTTHVVKPRTIHDVTMATIDVVLAEARGRLDRLGPHGAQAATASGALLVDLRPEVNRRTEGTIPGALVIERNELEWRLDPESESHIPQASHDAWVILFCNEGYASSLAATSLHAVGVTAATDIIGGYRAWRAAGLPVLEPVA
jgi:rhodanese-related sulfurtransferase